MRTGVDACDCTRDSMNTVRESALKVCFVTSDFSLTIILNPISPSKIYSVCDCIFIYVCHLNKHTASVFPIPVVC